MSNTPIPLVELLDELIAWAEDAAAIASVQPTISANQNPRWLRWTCILGLTTCADCLNRNGMIYEPDNDFWETGKENPPLHPNCRCRLDRLSAIIAGTATKQRTDGADYVLAQTGELPDYYISKKWAISAGWRNTKGNLAEVLPCVQIGGEIFYNNEKKLPDAPGRVWYEADINFEHGFRNGHRVLYSSDGLIFVTYNHYHSFYEVIGGSSW